MAHDDEAGHDHGEIHYRGVEANAATIEALAPLHPRLAESLTLAARFRDLAPADKETLLAAHSDVETFPAWTPGFHARGDSCAGCGRPTSPLFQDVFDEGSLPYAAFVDDVPVHASPACIAAFRDANPRLAPQTLDKLRRKHAPEGARPSARLTQFFRGDLMRHPPFALEDWANSVADANAGKLDKHVMRDMERLLAWAHRALYH